MLPTQPNSPLTVTQLNRQVKQLLETQYPAVPVKGEISTLSRPASGHIYFTLKDKNAQIRCAMFKGSLVRNRYIPKQGDEVIAFGRLSLYEGRGDYQLIVNTMQPVGEGALQAAFFQMKERLAAEGLFNEAHKQPLPEHIGTIGLVTSGTGAALHDILTVLKRRFPAMKVVLYPSQVQGNEATATIVQAIETANRRHEVDALIVGRGGGSLEDLWCFNTEPVARAIFNSKLPIISAVGHEVDVSIADFVADQRAATPSQAAEMISPDQFELSQFIDQLEMRLQRSIENKLAILAHRQQGLSQRIKSPRDMVAQWRKTLETLKSRLSVAVQLPVQRSRNRLSEYTSRLNAVGPAQQVIDYKRDVETLNLRLSSAINNVTEPKRHSLQQLVSSLNLLSPLSTLDRGYSITRDAKHRVIHETAKLRVGDSIETLLSEGRIISVVAELDSTHADDTQ